LEQIYAELQGEKKKRKIQIRLRTEFNCPFLKWSPLLGVIIKKKMKSKNSEIRSV
jgi:hypothetical protein